MKEVDKMETDYKKLCAELFGTDDVEKLRHIAEEYKKKNTRNAGRKKKYTAEEIKRMKHLRDHGVGLQKIADEFGTSRQVVGRYLSEAPTKGSTLRLTYMFRQHPCTVIDVDFLEQKISIQNKTADPVHRAFGVIENPTWKDFEVFLRERCFPETRGNKKNLLRQLGLTGYDPLQIVEKTQGRMVDDELWLKFRYLERKTE